MPPADAIKLGTPMEDLPEVLLTAEAQRWDPAELLRVPLQAKAEGRDRSTTENRRKAAQFPAGKTSSPGTGPARRSPPPPQQARSRLPRLRTTAATKPASDPSSAPAR